MLSAIFLVLGSVAANAGPVDTFGFGAAAVGRGHGGVAIPDGGLTVFRNPALLQGLDWAEVSVGYTLNRSAFAQSPPVYWDTNQDGAIDDLDAPLVLAPETGRADGMTLGIARNVGDRIGLALNLFLPTDEFLRLRTTEPALPTWVMHGNRAKRVEIGVGIGVEVFEGISVGLGTELQAQARYRIHGTLDMAAGAGDGDAEDLGDLIEYVRMDVHEMTLDLVPQYVPVAGLHWDVGRLNPTLNGLQFGLSWRGAGGIPVVADIDLQINGSLNDLGELDPIGIALVIPVKFSIFDHFVPERWSFGAAYQHKRLPRVYMDVHHTRWSEMEVNVAHVAESAIRSQIFQVEKDLLIDANQFDTVFKNTLSVNAGVEVFLPDMASSSPFGVLSPVLRGGFGYIPSPLVSQDARTAFLDADRLLLSGGFGLNHADPWGLVPGPVSWDIFYSRQQLAKGALQVPESDTPRAGAPVDGAAIPIAGHLWSAGLQFSVSF